MMVRIAALSRHRSTLFWDRLRFIYSEDSELSLFLREKGYNMAKVQMETQHPRSQTVNRTPEVQAKCREAQAANHALCRERYRYHLDRRSMSFPIVIRRAHSLGDVILTTPIIRALRKTLPLCPIHMETDESHVFFRNPMVTSANRSQPRLHNELRITFDMGYEQTISTHIVQGYEWVTRNLLPGLEPVELKTDLFTGHGRHRMGGGNRARTGRSSVLRDAHRSLHLDRPQLTT